MALYGPERLRTWLLSQQWFTSYLLPAMPRGLRWGLRKVYFLPLDLLDRRGNRSGPPRSQNFSGAVSSFDESADQYVQVLCEVAGLTPSSRVLDIGCGLGRLGVGLSRYFDDKGLYDGVDIVPDGIAWCMANVTSQHPNCRFHHANVHNAEYNPKGTIKAVEYKLPWPDATFDVIALTSVFTHMLPAEVDNYLGEIARVLKPTGHCYATYCILNSTTRELMKQKGAIFNFRYDYGTYAVTSRAVPELAVGYDEGFIRQLYTKYGMTFRHYPGYWCGQPSHWSQDESRFGEQDLIVSTRT